MSNLVHIEWVLTCLSSVSVHFSFGKVLKTRIKSISSKSQICGCGKGCGHKKGSNGVAYDDSYCDKF